MEVAPCHIEDAAPGSSRKKAEGWDLATFRCDRGCPKSKHLGVLEKRRRWPAGGERERERERGSRVEQPEPAGVRRGGGGW